MLQTYRDDCGVSGELFALLDQLRVWRNHAVHPPHWSADVGRRWSDTHSLPACVRDMCEEMDDLIRKSQMARTSRTLWKDGAVHLERDLLQERRKQLERELDHPSSRLHNSARPSKDIVQQTMARVTELIEAMGLRFQCPPPSATKVRPSRHASGGPSTALQGHNRCPPVSAPSCQSESTGTGSNGIGPNGTDGSTQFGTVRCDAPHLRRTGDGSPLASTVGWATVVRGPECASSSSRCGASMGSEPSMRSEASLQSEASTTMRSEASIRSEASLTLSEPSTGSEASPSPRATTRVGTPISDGNNNNDSATTTDDSKLKVAAWTKVRRNAKKHSSR